MDQNTYCSWLWLDLYCRRTARFTSQILRKDIAQNKSKRKRLKRKRRWKKREKVVKHREYPSSFFNRNCVLFKGWQTSVYLYVHVHYFLRYICVFMYLNLLSVLYTVWTFYSFKWLRTANSWAKKLLYLISNSTFHNTCI